MRSVKTSGGLTRGTGMSETQRNVWLMSMPTRADVNDAMQSFTRIKFETSEQHKDSSNARQTKDASDTLELLTDLRNRSPFSQEPSLRSIANGLTADSNVNVEQSRIIGQRILDSMVDKDVEDFTFKKSNQSVTLGMRTQAKLQDDIFQVDPHLMFQRLVAIGRGRSEEQQQEIFKYELCSFPPALFESSGLPLEAKKADLADTLWKEVKHEESLSRNNNVHYILDGGALLHRIPWPRGMSYSKACQMYVDYVSKRYASSTIVFDGYSDQPTIKDATHLRRYGGAQ
ncbi:uncharacterized protein [Amphiura filiformis]|uniref:uncharacterized protein n=1 Tax=Amphiura filiformis TaxID=82378 RepID=UPI003B219CD6